MVIIKDEKEQHGNPRLALFLILLTITITAAFFVYLKTRGIDPEKTSLGQMLNEIFSPSEKLSAEERIYELQYDPEVDKAVGVSGTYIIKCGPEGIKQLTSKGIKDREFGVSFKNPLIISNGKFAGIFDIDHDKICIMKGNNIIWQREIQNNIITGNVNINGYCSVIQQVKGFKSGITVYDPEGNEIFTRSLNDRYAVSAQVSPLNRRVIFNCIDAEGILASTLLEFTDILGGNNAAVIPQKDTVCPLMECFDDDSFCIASNKKLMFYDNSNNCLWDNDFSKIYSIGKISGSILVAAVKNNKGRQVVLMYDDKGLTKAEIPIDDEIINMRFFADICAVNTGREVIFINRNGSIIDGMSSIDIIRDIMFFNRGQVLIRTTRRLFRFDIYL